MVRDPDRDPVWDPGWDPVWDPIRDPVWDLIGIRFEWTSGVFSCLKTEWMFKILLSLYDVRLTVPVG